MKEKDKIKLSEKIARKRISDTSELKGDGWIMYEDPYIYDGWCAVANQITKEVILRDAYFIDRMTKKKRIEIIEGIKKCLDGE